MSPAHRAVVLALSGAAPHDIAAACRILRRELPATVVVVCGEDSGPAEVVADPGAGNRSTVAAVREWLRARLREPITLEEMARHAHLSRRQFTRTFRAETGASPWQWLLEQRLATARQMIESTDEPIESISRWCGFATPAAFRARFKQFAGEPPSSYRARVRAGSGSGGIVIDLFAGRRGHGVPAPAARYRPASSRRMVTGSPTRTTPGAATSA